MDDLKELAEILTELSLALRRLALDLGFFAVRVTALKSDARVVQIPRHLVRLDRQEVSNN
ncbi:MAG TPA: hypothetical protein VIE37_15185 [Methylomirabilota bacterium]|jgi:hypothetical protein